MCVGPGYMYIRNPCSSLWTRGRFDRVVDIQNFGLCLTLHFPGALLLFVLVGLSGCILTCFDSRVRGDLAQPCRQLIEATCCQGLASAGDCACLSVAGEGASLLIMGAVIAIGISALFGFLYSILAATIFGQRIWQRHYHILAKKMQTKEYVVEDVDGLATDSNWSPPPLPPEHIQQLKALGFL
ncbi:hypothetical protein MKX01_021179 [Papaver californicum]|nr:hypothetical protein MKX01_021179 [Papaver californicum]